LAVAASGGYLELVCLLLNTGADVHAADFFHWTPLHQAVHQNRFEMFQLLVDAGARVDDQGLGRKTPLHWAARACHVEAAKFLLENGAKSISMRDGNL
ncbi:ankyrin repeat protein, partial [Baffinella frigidus]